MNTPAEPGSEAVSKTYSTVRGLYGPPQIILLNEKQWSYVQRYYQLSPRELQVARLVCRGNTNDDMAQKLKVKQGTIKTHLRSIFSKARARNKITLLLRFVAIANHLTEQTFPNTASDSNTD